MTGPNGIRTSPPVSAITGSTRAWRILRRRHRTANDAPSMAGPGGSPPIDQDALSAEHRVDAAMMADSVARRVFEIDELREHTWNPLQANPGRAIYQLLARDFAPLSDRLASVAARLAAIPAMLAEARRQLGRMPRVHLETAIGQFDGTIALVSKEIDVALEAAPQCAAQLAQVRPAALEALTEHRSWLSAQLAGPDGFADPRIGPELFARKLSLTLSAAADADAILARAEADLDRASEEIAEAGRRDRRRGHARPRGGPGGARPAGRGRAGQHDHPGVLPRRARRADRLRNRPPPAHGLRRPGRADRDAGNRPRGRGGVLRLPRPARAVAAVDVHRGVADADRLAAERVASFYREYNRHMVHNLMVHEAMPGHYLQLQHSRRFTGSDTAIRAALRSGSFTEGWAVYTERIMAEQGYPGEGDPRAVRMQQLKMQLRTIINAILDARIHAHGMTEAEAMALMTGRGYQEEGEAAGKWRRAQLTSAQLSTYYVGYSEISDLARRPPGGRSRPDRPAGPRSHAGARLAPVRLLRTLIGAVNRQPAGGPARWLRRARPFRLHRSGLADSGWPPGGSPSRTCARPATSPST